MRRPTSLTVDTTHELAYELDNSPPASLYSDDDIKHNIHDSADAYDDKHVSSPLPTISPAPSPAPSIRLLFSLIAPHRRLFLLFPAILASLVSGGIAPFMTVAIGQVFNAFATFSNSQGTDADKQAILHDVGIGSLELIGLAVGSIALGSVTSGLWISTGEHNVMNLRKYVYAAVTSKDMTWFDTKMGAEENVQSFDAANDGPVGAGGLMAKFSRETDEVRMASSLASGRLIQYMATCITCLALAFINSWALTLVILASVPVLIIVQTVSQALAGPLLGAERSQTSVAGTIIDRAVSSIATVKAFNATAHEASALNAVFERLRVVDRGIVTVWGFTSGVSQFVMMSMFVQAFWFGSKLVKEGRLEPGDVMAVFWACLIATSNLQMCIPLFITLTRGKFAMVSLLSIAQSHDDGTGSYSSLATTSAARLAAFRTRIRRSQHLRGVIPTKCHGEVVLHNVTFAYPSRPTVPVLQDVSVYLPASETTFIVGGSGSGKSTISLLLLRLYKVHTGEIELDEQDMAYLDENWTKKHISVVSQNCILFDMSVHDNVAMGLAGGESGRAPESVTRKEVEEACRAALIHDFIRDLPEGYETKLGNGGANLSGGQKQRLAIARAHLRNPSVLILDEATSALDPTSRVLVFEAIKRWRQNKTTIVITHDLSQITYKDFVYVLRSGSVVEQGYRADLEKAGGDFRQMMDSQGATGLPTKDIDETERAFSPENPATSVEESEESFTSIRHTMMPTLHGSAVMGSWMFDAVADLTSKAAAPRPALTVNRESRRISRFVPLDAFTAEVSDVRRRRPSSVHITPATPTGATTTHTRRYSLQVTPTTPSFSLNAASSTSFPNAPRNGRLEKRRSQRISRSRAVYDDMKRPSSPLEVKIHKSRVYPPSQNEVSLTSSNKTIVGLLREVYPHLPNKPLVIFGLVLCLLSGAITPIFSFVLSRLFFEVSHGARNNTVINQFGAIILSIAAMDGILMGSKYIVMESSAMMWITKIRRVAFDNVLCQDKKWFDKSDSSPARVVQVLMKDGDDARNLVAVVIGQFVVVTAMFSLGLTWALIRGWQLTLAGFSIGPVFAGAMALQARLVSNCEMNNKRAREEVAQDYYAAISNIRGIRSMSFEPVFQKHFDSSADRALVTGIKGAFVEGCTLGLSSGLIYFAEALIFYVGAVLMANGTYDYLQLLEVLNMVVFTVSIGSQLMAFTEKISKASNATRDFHELLNLSTKTEESRGIMQPEIDGNVTFRNVDFSYPERPDVPVLRSMNLEIHEGECVAIVGASGSGKSTVAALLQRLYEPTYGSIWTGLNELRSTDVRHLRDHVSVVSQNPNLFDATIFENIAYGNKLLSEHDIHVAAKAAHVHDFIMSLPQGYETMVGENASLISGGQAQRLQIARALARPSKILILDECTSALDPANQAAVLETIRHAKVGRTTVMVTHKLAVMQTCDRILVIDNGKVAEQGTFSYLMERKGIFSSLVTGGGIVGE